MPVYRDEIINRDSFVAGEEIRAWVGSKHYPEGLVIENGTVEVTLYGETRRVAALLDKDGSIWARGIGGRYMTGGKVWPATVSTNKNGGTYVFFGRDDRSGRFNKANGLFFMEKKKAL